MPDSGDSEKVRRREGITDGVDVAPVGLDLRMLERVAVDLAGAGKQEARADSLGQAEHVEGAHHIGLVKSESRKTEEHKHKMMKEKKKKKKQQRNPNTDSENGKRKKDIIVLTGLNL